MSIPGNITTKTDTETNKHRYERIKQKRGSTEITSDVFLRAPKQPCDLSSPRSEVRLEKEKSCEIIPGQIKI